MYVVISSRVSETIGLQSQIAADQEPQTLYFHLAWSFRRLPPECSFGNSIARGLVARASGRYYASRTARKKSSSASL